MHVQLQTTCFCYFTNTGTHMYNRFSTHSWPCGETILTKY